MIVVRRNSGDKSCRILGRFRVPACFFWAQIGDSGKNRRMRINGKAGMMPDMSVKRHGARLTDMVPKLDSRNPGIVISGRYAAQALAMSQAPPTRRPPIDEN